MKLNEFKYMNQPASNSSGSFKKKFTNLINYHIDHASSELESITKKDIRDTYFHVAEHYNNGHHEFDRDIVVSYDKDSKTFFFRIFVDGKEVDSTLCYSYEELVEVATNYMFLPDSMTPEYDDLLVEFVLMKNSNTSSQAASSNKTSSKNYPDQTDRYKRLLSQIKADGLCKVTVNLLDDRILAFTTHDGLPVKIIFKPYVPSYLVQIDGGDIYCEDYEEVLQILMDIEVIKNTDLCESYSSIADDFKTYENLWD